MFDGLIYRLLDRIVATCKCIKEYMKNRSLPKACYDTDARQEQLKKWAKERENDYK